MPNNFNIFLIFQRLVERKNIKMGFRSGHVPSAHPRCDIVVQSQWLIYRLLAFLFKVSFSICFAFFRSRESLWQRWWWVLEKFVFAKKTRHPIYEKNLNCFFEKGLTRPLCVCFCSFQTTFNRKMSTLAGFELGSLE